MWHLLQLSDSLDAEFGSALAELVPLTAWKPVRTWLPRSRSVRKNGSHLLQDPPLRFRHFPLLHGFSRWPMSRLAVTENLILELLLSETPDPTRSPLICTVPYFAAVAERWPGPVVYWLTDRIERYASANARQVHALDRRMCSRATLLCPNSTRIADYLVREGGCSSAKTRVLPNATRANNLLSSPTDEPGPLPKDLADLPRPIIGVIGNLASNVDWRLLRQMVCENPGLSWAFVGPYGNVIKDVHESAYRQETMTQPNVRFVGKKPYGDLAAYARAFDVAMLPYLHCEPTYSGSSTRYYEHLAAGRPMLATRGFEELLHKEPLLQLFSGAEEGTRLLARLHAQQFKDGHSVTRWEASREGTWQIRARHLIDELLAISGSDLRTAVT